MNKEISKRTFWRYVNIKINRVIHHYHVFAVISILFDEIISDLISGKQIKIFNFGTLYLKSTNPRKYYDVRFNKIMESGGNKIMKFSLSNKFKKKLIKYVSLDEIKKGD